MRPQPDMPVVTLDGSGLTGREREVFWLVAERLRNREIAERLHIGIRTVESHVSTILRKLGGEQRDDIVALAARIARRQVNGAAPPAPLSLFVGREAEAAELTCLTRAERLITLVGPPGRPPTCHRPSSSTSPRRRRTSTCSGSSPWRSG
jgi:DNA-binding CsgD family transcriptional regulator